ncbi:MAG TPA: cytochrome c biogenesis protein CcdA, partial [Burkholderiales bacterium]|nr:cytochrome c biogenesis protein CcdA [Burkholderiales bacterium]
LTLGATQAPDTGATTLLAVYAAGLGIPFLVVALFTRELAARMRPLRRLGWALQIAAGLVLVAMGIAMMTGNLSRFAYWLLEMFPALGRIG